MFKVNLKNKKIYWLDRGIRLVVLSALSLMLIGCSTVLEELTPSSGSIQYSKVRKRNGETVYRGARVRRPSYIYYDPQPSISYSGSSFGATASYNEDMSSGQSEYKEPPSSSFSGNNLSFDINTNLEYSHVGVNYKFINETNFEVYGGVSMFVASDFYFGFDAGARLLLEISSVKPFVGFGGYLGDHKRCEYDPYLSYEECEKKFLSAGYLEYGIRFSDQFSIFSRAYSINRAGVSIPGDQFYGIGISF